MTEQPSAGSATLAEARNQHATPTPEPGQLWRVRWNDQAGVVLVLTVADDHMRVAPVSLDELPDETAADAPASTNTLGLPLAIWRSDAAAIASEGSRLQARRARRDPCLPPAGDGELGADGPPHPGPRPTPRPHRDARGGAVGAQRHHRPRPRLSPPRRRPSSHRRTSSAPTAAPPRFDAVKWTSPPTKPTGSPGFSTCPPQTSWPPRSRPCPTRSWPRWTYRRSGTWSTASPSAGTRTKRKPGAAPPTASGRSPPATTTVATPVGRSDPRLLRGAAARDADGPRPVTPTHRLRRGEPRCSSRHRPWWRSPARSSAPSSTT